MDDVVVIDLTGANNISSTFLPCLSVHPVPWTTADNYLNINSIRIFFLFSQSLTFTGIKVAKSNRKSNQVFLNNKLAEDWYSQMR